MTPSRRAPVPPADRARTRRSIFAISLFCGVAFLAGVIALSAPALADGTWDGSGSFTFTSTPAPGFCGGSGTAQISLSGTGSGGTDSGPFTIHMSSISAGCGGGYFPAPGTGFTVQVSLSQSGNDLDGQTAQGDHVWGSYTNGALQLSLTPASSSGGGGVCAEYCTTVYTFTMQGSGSLFASDLFSPSFAGLAALFGGLLGFGGLIAALASFRGAHVAASTVPALAPTHVTTGYIPSTPTGGGGVASGSTMLMPAGTAPAGGWPSWATDYRTTPYQPNPAIAGWSDLVSKFQISLGGKAPRPPTYPQQVEPVPPTSWPGTYCQPRVNPQTGRLSWWDPVGGTFPWG